MSGRLIGAALLAISSITATIALAHSGATGIVKERMDGMKAMTEGLKSLVPMIKKERPYDPQTVRDVATVLQTHAGQNMLELFPEGSLQMPTEARPEIWTNWEDFSRQAMRLSVMAQGLALSAETGLAAPGSAQVTITGATTAQEIGALPVPVVLNAIGENCLACHTDYRIKTD